MKKPLRLSRPQLITCLKEETRRLSKVPSNYKILEFCRRKVTMVKSGVAKESTKENSEGLNLTGWNHLAADFTEDGET